MLACVRTVRQSASPVQSIQSCSGLCHVRWLDETLHRGQLGTFGLCESLMGSFKCDVSRVLGHDDFPWTSLREVDKGIFEWLPTTCSGCGRRGQGRPSSAQRDLTVSRCTMRVVMVLV